MRLRKPNRYAPVSDGIRIEMAENQDTTERMDVGQGQGARPMGWLDWRLEFTVCFIALICDCSMFGFLVHYNGKPTPDWSLGLTINTIVALCVTLSKMCLLIAIESVVQQRKWLWFYDGSRVFKDFRLHEGASQGPWGAFKLLGSKLFDLGPTTILCSVLVITFVFSSAFTQLTILYLVQLAPVTNATAEATVLPYLSRWNTTDFAPHDDDRLIMGAALPLGAFENGTIPHLEPHCDTADCTWPNYGTLGLCSAVANITDLADKSVLEAIKAQTRRKIGELRNMSTSPFSITNWITPGRYHPTYAIVASYVPSPTRMFNDSIVRAMHADMFVAYSNRPINITAGFDGNLTGFWFIEVAFFWCTQTLSSRSALGRVSTTEISSKSLIQTENHTQSLNVMWRPDFSVCYMPDTPPCTGFGGTDISFAPPDGLPSFANRSFRLDLWTALAASFTTVLGISGGMLQTAGLSVYASEGNIFLAISRALFGDRMGLTPYPPEEQLSNLEGTAHNIAVGISNGMRKLAPSQGAAESIVRGTAYYPVASIHVRWQFLSLLWAQLPFTVLVLFVTVVESWKKNIPVLKGDPLATIQSVTESGVSDCKRQKRKEEAQHKSLRRDGGPTGRLRLQAATVAADAPAGDLGEAGVGPDRGNMPVSEGRCCADEPASQEATGRVLAREVPTTMEMTASGEPADKLPAPNGAIIRSSAAAEQQIVNVSSVVGRVPPSDAVASNVPGGCLPVNSVVGNAAIGVGVLGIPASTGGDIN